MEAIDGSEATERLIIECLKSIVMDSINFKGFDIVESIGAIAAAFISRYFTFAF